MIVICESWRWRWRWWWWWWVVVAVVVVVVVGWLIVVAMAEIGRVSVKFNSGTRWYDEFRERERGCGCVCVKLPPPCSGTRTSQQGNVIAEWIHFTLVLYSASQSVTKDPLSLEEEEVSAFLTWSLLYPGRRLCQSSNYKRRSKTWYHDTHICITFVRLQLQAQEGTL